MNSTSAPVRRSVISHAIVLAGMVWGCVILTAAAAGAQPFCPGDVTTTVAALFGDGTSTDANHDGALSAADVVAVLVEQTSCAGSPTPTASPTATPRPPTPTRTATSTPTTSVHVHTATPTPTGPTATPTSTDTPPPTATPTEVCIVQPAGIGTPISGQLTDSDCKRVLGESTQARPADVYAVSGTPGSSILVSVTTAGGPNDIRPFLAVIDADGQFDEVQGQPPIQFLVTTTQPYEIVVGTDIGPADGPYTLTLTTIPCPTPVALTIPGLKTANLTGSECPDPSSPTVGVNANPADLYTFTVTTVPTSLTIIMRQSNAADSIDPSFSIFGPDGFEVLPPDQGDDLGGGVNGLDAEARFLALQTGTYTIVAMGGGGTGAYSLQISTPVPFCVPTALPPIPATTFVNCPQQSSGCSGILYGDTSLTPCAAPLPIPGLSPDTPDLAAPSALYSFTANPGDVISVEMTSDDDAHLYLLGPDTAGYPLVTQDDDSGPVSATSDSQLAATLLAGGRYIIVAADNSMLQPPDPSIPNDHGDMVHYQLFVQKCPLQSQVLNPNPSASLSGSFGVSDCFGFGGVPYRSYPLMGKSGQFVSTLLSSNDFDAFVRVFGPDGSVAVNDNDLFDPNTSNARANRILPADGLYIVEVSSSISQGGVDVTPPPPAFTLQATTCPVTAVSAGTSSGAWQDSDCTIASTGQKFDVYSFTAGAGPVPGVASIVPPPNGCVVALLADGTQTPENGCSTQPIDVPILDPNGLYGFIVAAQSAATRGSYNVQLTRCGLQALGFSAAATGGLNAGSCRTAAGAPAAWFLVQGLADVVQFNDGISGEISASFPFAGTEIDRLGSLAVTGSFADDPDSMFSIGSNLEVLLRVTGVTPSDQGTYTVKVDSATLSQ